MATKETDREGGEFDQLADRFGEVSEQVEQLARRGQELIEEFSTRSSEFYDEAVAWFERNQLTLIYVTAGIAAAGLFSYFAGHRGSGSVEERTPRGIPADELH